MKLIVITSPTSVTNETQAITSMFEEGLDFLHIHKPTFSKKEIENFIQQIPAKYHKQISMHADFPKFHSLEALKDHHPSPGQMAFLSPVFDSISKNGYKSKFTDRLNKFTQIKPELIATIKGKNMVALGGVDTDKLELLKRVGFKGVATLGAIWHSKKPVEKFIDMRNIVNSKAFLRQELFLDESQNVSTTKLKRSE